MRHLTGRRKKIPAKPGSGISDGSLDSWDQVLPTLSVGRRLLALRKRLGGAGVTARCLHPATYVGVGTEPEERNSDKISRACGCAMIATAAELPRVRPARLSIRWRELKARGRSLP